MYLLSPLSEDAINAFSLAVILGFQLVVMKGRKIKIIRRHLHYIGYRNIQSTIYNTQAQPTELHPFYYTYYLLSGHSDVHFY